MKKRFKLYKSGKVWKIVAIAFATSVIGTSLIGRQVHADVNQNGETTKLVSKNNENNSNQSFLNASVEENTNKTSVINDLNANNGNLDSYKITTNVNGQAVLNASGWHAAGQSINEPSRYAILFDETTNQEVNRQHIQNVSRPDVAQAYPNIVNSSNSGFNVQFELPTNLVNHSFGLVLRYSDDALSGEGNRTDYWFHTITLDQGNHASLDVLSSDQNGNLTVAGWHASNQALGKKYHYIIAYDQTTNSEITRQLVAPVSRPDVAQAFPTISNAEDSGFSVQFKLTPQYSDNVTFLSRWTDDPAGNGINPVDYWFAPIEKQNLGNLDSYDLSTGKLIVNGWHANDISIYQPYHYLILFDNTAQRQVACLEGGVRASSDVQNVFNSLRTAGRSRFNNIFASDTPLEAGHSYSLVSRYSINNAGNGDDSIATHHTDYWYPAFTFDQQAYSIDNYSVDDDNQMYVNGWFANDAAVDKNNAFVIVLMNGQEVARKRVELSNRQDVAQVYPTLFNSQNSGFSTTVQLPQRISGDLQFVLRFSDDVTGEGNNVDIWTSTIDNGFMKNRMIRHGNQVTYYDNNGNIQRNFVSDGILYLTDNQGNILNVVNPDERQISRISFLGNLSGITKDNKKAVQVKLLMKNGQQIDAWATVKWQGNSTLMWPKKAYRIKLFKDQNLSEKLKLKLPNSGYKTNSFNLKANFTEPTAGLNIVNAKLFSEVTATRDGISDSIVNKMPNYGQVAGLPIELDINNLDQGLYVLETYHEDKLYDLNDKKSDNIALEDNQTTKSTFSEPFVVGDLEDTAFANISPAKVDESVADQFNQLYQLANTNNDGDYSRLEGQYLDVPAAIDYLAFSAAINNTDGITKNAIYISKKGSKWVIMPYDLDASWNNDWDSGLMDINSNFFDTLKGYDNKLLLTIFNHHQHDLASRYFELRQNVLSDDNVIKVFNDWFTSVGNTAYANNDALWGDMNLSGYTHRNSVDQDQFIQMIKQRLAVVDRQMAELGSMDNIWLCVKSC